MRPRLYELAEVLALAKSGASAAAITKRLRCNPTYTYRLLRKAGWTGPPPMPARAWKTGPGPGSRSPEATERRRQLRKEEAAKAKAPERCRCGLLLPCESCLPTLEERALRGWGQWE